MKALIYLTVAVYILLVAVLGVQTPTQNQICTRGSRASAAAQAGCSGNEGQRTDASGNSFNVLANAALCFLNTRLRVEGGKPNTSHNVLDSTSTL
ncbi:hypothetical protein PF005_g556 [Phytophthora fragariae]|uniref:Pectate lyase n=1 Tax=Phytophthora fragariae TaxID=53985 RepID=A0A6A3ZME4_9STRA|nr:hypothetical protein PF003_g19191 [Phytophthora fragariae]KAE8949863.1 hypothetical protein PF009_g610 [Phytophthora fragariae]KAE9030996.1 hypothetical protein PF011_g342 [Phytophthora fragariae]KAE9139146.1 hypothetical protein PF010_g709 [Phytophthora fragariae]KAE9140444.1 hypothetical protein PF007_g643 [Phytophthora fragariae]